MTREQAKALLPVIQAWAEGKTIQWKDIASKEGFEDVTGENPGFDSPYAEWRIKPEPREFWLVQGLGAFNTPERAAMHVAKDDIIHVREVVDSASEPDSKPLKCPWCGTDMEHDSDASKWHHEDVFSCEKCGVMIRRDGLCGRGES